MKEVKTMIKSAYLKHPIFSNDNRILADCGMVTEGVKFSTRYGKWSIVDFCTVISHTTDSIRDWVKYESYCCIVALFEHDTLGDMTDYVLAYYDVFSGDNCWKEIDGTYDDIRTALIDNEIVEG